MLQNIRDNAQGVIAKIIIGFICLTFAMFGVDALFGISGGGKTVAEVNGVEIDEREVLTAMDLRRRQIYAQMGDQIDPSMIDEKVLRAQVTESLVNRKLLLQLADEYKLAFSDDQINNLIVNTPEFQVDGRFDPAVFENIVRTQGFGPRQFTSFVREEMLIQHLQSGFLNSAFITSAELDRVVRLEKQTRDIAWLTLPAEKFGSEIEISEERIASRYNAGRDRFRTPEAVRVEYVELNRDVLAEQVQVSEEEVRASFEQQLDAVKQAEERDAQHILISTEEVRSEEEALALAQDIRARIEQGLSFEDAAREFSEDAGTAEDGGRLGYIPRGMFSEKFEVPLFSLEVGKVSEPVRTGYGYHLMRVNAVRMEESPEYAELRERIAAELRRSRADQLYAEKVQELAEISYESGDLAEPAAVTGLAIQQSGFFTRDGGEGIGSVEAVVRAAFSEDVLGGGLNSEVIEYEEGRAIVLRVADRRPSEPQPLEAVREQVISEIRAEEGVRRARELGEKVLSDLRRGESTSWVAVEHGLEWEVRGSVGRTDQEVPPRVLDTAFSLPAPEPEGKSLGQAELPGGDFVIVSVTRIEQGRSSTKLSSGELRRLREFHAAVRGSQAFEAFRRNLEAQAEIRRF